MKKKEWFQLILIFVVILLVAFVKDVLLSENLLENGKIKRGDIGEDSKNIGLVLNVEGLLEDVPYELDVLPEKVTKEKAEAYLAEAIQMIDSDFKTDLEEIPMQNSYVSDLVEAEWIFSPIGFITSEGTICWEKFSQEEEVITAEVTLSCGEYETIYSFPFVLKKQALSEQEILFQSLAQNIENQMQEEGESYLNLPVELNGYLLNWKEKKEYLFWKILLLEMIAVGGICIAQKQEKENQEKKKKFQMELEYPDVLNQLLVLLEAGMTTRLAWKMIARQYMQKREKHMIPAKDIYEEIIIMQHRLEEGESDRRAYQEFSNSVNVMCYRRLMRILLSNIEKGTDGLCSLLEEETHRAYEERILLAKRLGEEASTKMLIPLMMMMVLVMAIVLLPAVLQFSL